MKQLYKKKYLSSFRIIIVGFFILIMVGSLLLSLPIATKGGEHTTYMDALFTSTSAVCVTGLVVHDTATHWTAFGQAVIFILIQIGGMGVVTVAAAITIISGKKIGLMERNTIQEALAAPSLGGIVRLTGFIIKMTFFIELIGAVLLAPVFIRQYDVAKGLWYSIFHSVSAFCNAGFDLMGESGAFSSMTPYTAQPVVNIVLMCLIVIGGIGFVTWNDFRTNGLHIRKFRMQSKVILLVTAILILFPAVFFYFYEFSLKQWSGLSGGERIFASLFQSVSPRTAGFNTVDLSNMSEPGQMLTIILMLIGGSPGSTAGGMKTTTVAVLLLMAFSVFRRKEDTNCFGRRIPEETVKYAATVMVMYFTLFLSAGLVISAAEQVPVLTAMFEAASAIATVGLSLGLTPQLGLLSKIILIGLMFIGRVGGLTIVFAAVSGTHANLSKLPQEKITVG